MILTDTHCHLDFQDFDHDRPATLARAWEAGIKRILIPGIDLHTSQTAIRIAERYDEICAAVGTHPNSVQKFLPNQSVVFSLTGAKPHARRNVSVAILYGMCFSKGIVRRIGP